jgi:hypothetical protein
MAVLTPQSVTSAGITPTVITPGASGDKVPVNSILRVTNGTVGSITITMTTHQSVDGNLAVADRTVSIPASQTRTIRATGIYANPADGYVDVLSSDTTAAVDIEVFV